MNVRKQRTHQCGLANVDFRTKGDTAANDFFNPTMKFADVGTMSKSHYKQTAGEVDPQMSLKANNGWARQNKPDPRVETTVQFYNAHGKKPKAPVLVANTRTKELEKEEWTDKVFTGDNVAVTAQITADASKRDQNMAKMKTRDFQDRFGNGIKHKFSQLANLLAQERAKNTLAHLIDPQHLQDIRRALRRKYASRTNLERIFHQWDKDHKGNLTVDDLYLGLNKIGITTSLDQATALHANAKQIDEDPNLCLEEFSQLIFDHDESLKANLSKLQHTDKNLELDLSKKLIADKTMNRIDLTSMTPQHLDRMRVRNKWRSCIQNNLQNITKDLLVLDSHKTYQAEPRDFMKVLEKRVIITETMKQQREELHEYLLEFQDQNSGKINYVDMAMDLRQFNYDLETNEGILPKKPSSISSGRASFFGKAAAKNIFNDDYIILDSQQVPQNKLEIIERQMIKVNRYLKDKFGSAEAFTKNLREKADKDKNGNLTVEEFKNFIKETCEQELVDRKLQKRDVEGFLSAFVYNKYGATNIDKIAPLVFEKDANKLSLSIAGKVRANPPPEFVNEELGFTESNVLQGNDAQARRLRNLLVEIENSSYVGNASTFSIFRAFDVDGDGFVSHKDFEKHLIQQKIHASKEDIATLMKHVLDKDGDGYVDYAAFSKRFGPSMSRQVEVKDKELNLPNLAPNKDKLIEYGNRSKSLRDAVNTVRRSFQPEPDTKLVPATRFGSKPAHKNTFTNYQPAQQAPGFLTEKERLGQRLSTRNLQDKVDFQKDDKEKARKIQDSKIASKKLHAEQLSYKIQMYEQEQMSMQTAKMLTKAGKLDNYEKVFHLHQ